MAQETKEIIETREEIVIKTSNTFGALGLLAGIGYSFLHKKSVGVTIGISVVSAVVMFVAANFASRAIIK